MLPPCNPRPSALATSHLVIVPSFTGTNRYICRPALVFPRDAIAACPDGTHIHPPDCFRPPSASLMSKRFLTFPAKRLVVRMRVFVAPPLQAVRESSNLLRFPELRVGKRDRGRDGSPFLSMDSLATHARGELAPLPRSRKTHRWQSSTSGAS